MSLPSAVRSQVDPAAVTKVTRLFNNTIGDVLAELFQNARRAGATTVSLQTSGSKDAPWLSVADDGAGITDPSVVLALGRSGWDGEVARREDPAGMGVFSLAGRRVIIRSRPNTATAGWSIDIPPEAWEDGTPIPVAAFDGPIGTEIAFALDGPWAIALDNAARTSARHCPLLVVLNGEELKREDWLAGAAAVFEDNGVRIGVFDDRRSNRVSHSVNFHGVTVSGCFDTIAEKDVQWCALVDIVDAPQLQLVLPARKEMVENEALAHLRLAVRRAIYRHIATRPDHTLPFERWSDAANIGVNLPEARAVLTAWEPASADIDTGITRSQLSPGAEPIIVGHFCPAIGQSACLALERDQRFEGRLAAADAQMAGYGWYDRLARVTDLTFEIERDGQCFAYSEAEFHGLESGVVDRLDLVVTLNGQTDDAIKIAGPVFVDYDEENCCHIDEANILLASPGAVTPEDLTDLLDGICFSSSDDRDADSWETQHDRFLLDAREIAVRALQGDDAATLERLRAVLARRVQWFVPDGRRFRAVISRDGLQLEIEPAPPRPD